MSGSTEETPALPRPDFSPPLYGRCFLALIAGAIGPLAFAPNNMWLLGFVSVMGQYMAWKNTMPRQGSIIGWFFGAGFFGVGVSWVYVSIHDYGYTSEFLAGLLTALFVAGLALFFALQGWILQRYFNRSFYLLSFAVLWVLCEWLRGWLLTGFPWLYLGYPHAHSGFSGLAPIFGVLSLSLVVAISGAGLGEMYLNYHRTRSLYSVARTYIPTSLFFLWIAASLTSSINWVTPNTDSVINVGIVQANIEQGRKFDQAFIQQNLDQYETLSAGLWRNDVVFWPETAIPYIADQAGPVLDYFSREARTGNAALVSGIFGRTEAGLHNSIISIGEGEGIYHKQKLVPFGEYVPLRALLASLLQLFDLPMSSLEKGPSGQALLTANNHTLAPFICYEVVYSDFVRRQARNADYLVTISNDTWFGASWGPLQHLEMASMRALENGRYMVRATNTGVSAIIDEKGNILSRTPQFEATILEGEIQVFEGRTPFSRWGSWPVLILCISLLILPYRCPVQLARLIAYLRQRNAS
jgi:apolipoprotein N-acyltransferase